MKNNKHEIDDEVIVFQKEDTIMTKEEIKLSKMLETTEVEKEIKEEEIIEEFDDFADFADLDIYKLFDEEDDFIEEKPTLELNLKKPLKLDLIKKQKQQKEKKDKEHKPAQKVKHKKIKKSEQKPVKDESKIKDKNVNADIADMQFEEINEYLHLSNDPSMIRKPIEEIVDTSTISIEPHIEKDSENDVDLSFLASSPAPIPTPEPKKSSFSDFFKNLFSKKEKDDNSIGETMDKKVEEIRDDNAIKDLETELAKPSLELDLVKKEKIEEKKEEKTFDFSNIDDLIVGGEKISPIGFDEFEPLEYKSEEKKELKLNLVKDQDLTEKVENLIDPLIEKEVQNFDEDDDKKKCKKKPKKKKCRENARKKVREKKVRPKKEKKKREKKSSNFKLVDPIPLLLIIVIIGQIVMAIQLGQLIDILSKLIK